MEAFIGTIIGGIIAGGAMLLNSFLSAKFTREREETSERLRLGEKEIGSLSKLYEQALHASDRLIRNMGRDSEDQLEKFYRIEIKLALHSTDPIKAAFSAVHSAISKMVSDLPEISDEFRPKFEEDYDRRARLERKKEAETKRNKAAQKLRPKCWGKHRELSDLMREHLRAKRNLEKGDPGSDKVA